MTMSDPLGDMLTRIRNGQHAQKKVIACPASKQKGRVLDVLQKEGFIRGYKLEDLGANRKQFQIELKYDQGEPAIREMRRVSKPGRRVYFGVKEMPRYYNGLGLTVVSTPHGVMSDHDARSQNVGGEALCQIF